MNACVVDYNWVLVSSKGAMSRSTVSLNKLYSYVNKKMNATCSSFLNSYYMLLQQQPNVFSALLSCKPNVYATSKVCQISKITNTGFRLLKYLFFEASDC